MIALLCEGLSLLLMLNEILFYSNCSAVKNDDQANLNFAWDVVKEKLMDSLNAIEHEGNLGNRAVDFEQNQAKRPLSLYAVAEGPRLRLLWDSLQRLQEEAGTVSMISILYV